MTVSAVQFSILFCIYCQFFRAFMHDVHELFSTREITRVSLNLEVRQTKKATLRLFTVTAAFCQKTTPSAFTLLPKHTSSV